MANYAETIRALKLERQDHETRIALIDGTIDALTELGKGNGNGPKTKGIGLALVNKGSDVRVPQPKSNWIPSMAIQNKVITQMRQHPEGMLTSEVTERAKIARGTADKALKHLVETGVLEVVRTTDMGGRVYGFAVPPGA